MYEAHITGERPSLLYTFGFAFRSSSVVAIRNDTVTGWYSGITRAGTSNSGPGGDPEATDDGVAARMRASSWSNAVGALLESPSDPVEPSGFENREVTGWRLSRLNESADVKANNEESADGWSPGAVDLEASDIDSDDPVEKDGSKPRVVTAASPDEVACVAPARESWRLEGGKEEAKRGNDGS